MKKNYVGYLITITLAIIYSVLSNNFNFDFVSMLGRIVGVLFIPLVITAVISGLSKQNRDFGKLMACITAITCVIALFGHFINKP